MSQEIYVKEIPKDCWDCPCQDNENGRCKILNRYVDYIPKDCPLKSLHEYKKELVAKVLEKVKKELDGDYNQYRINYILNQIQKEFEK